MQERSDPTLYFCFVFPTPYTNQAGDNLTESRYVMTMVMFANNGDETLSECYSNGHQLAVLISVPLAMIMWFCHVH